MSHFHQINLKVCKGRYFSGAFLIQNDVKQADTLTPWRFNFTFKLQDKAELELKGL